MDSKWVLDLVLIVQLESSADLRVKRLFFYFSICDSNFRIVKGKRSEVRLSV